MHIYKHLEVVQCDVDIIVIHIEKKETTYFVPFTVESHPIASKARGVAIGAKHRRRTPADPG